MENLEKINELINNKKYVEAKEELAKLIHGDEKDAEALKLLGLCHINLGEFKEGQGVFETVVKYKTMPQAGFILQVVMTIKMIICTQFQHMKKF